MDEEAPRSDLFRGLNEAPAVRAATEDGAGDALDTGTLMHGHFARFDSWTEIHSWFEGDFLERVAQGAFRKTFKENRSSVRVQFDHGYDTNVGSAPLGPIDELREEDAGAYYEVPLLDTDYNRDRILPLLAGRLMSGEDRGSQLGASFRFSITKDEWVREPKKSAANPTGLPERTIREVRLYEFGPVVFPAYADATSGVRSLTDHFHELRLKRIGTAERAASRLAPAAPSTDASSTPDEPVRHSAVPIGRLHTFVQADIARLKGVS